MKPVIYTRYQVSWWVGILTLAYGVIPLLLSTLGSVSNNTTLLNKVVSAKVPVTTNAYQSYCIHTSPTGELAIFWTFMKTETHGMLLMYPLWTIRVFGGEKLKSLCPKSRRSATVNQLAFHSVLCYATRRLLSYCTCLTCQCQATIKTVMRRLLQIQLFLHHFTLSNRKSVCNVETQYQWWHIFFQLWRTW